MAAKAQLYKNNVKIIIEIHKLTIVDHTCSQGNVIRPFFLMVGAFPAFYTQALLWTHYARWGNCIWPLTHLIFSIVSVFILWHELNCCRNTFPPMCTTDLNTSKVLGTDCVL